MNDSVHFSSESAEWPTPNEFFVNLDKEFSFTLDPCSTHENSKVEKHYTKEDDGLTKIWENEIVFMNPPYGREIVVWMKKAYESSVNNNSTVVCLVPSRTDTRWWHDYAMKGEIRFIKGRLKFGGHKNNAPFPSAVVIFRSNRNKT